MSLTNSTVTEITFFRFCAGSPKAPTKILQLKLSFAWAWQKKSTCLASLWSRNNQDLYIYIFFFFFTLLPLNNSTSPHFLVFKQREPSLSVEVKVIVKRKGFFSLLTQADLIHPHITATSSQTRAFPDLAAGALYLFPKLRDFMPDHKIERNFLGKPNCNIGKQDASCGTGWHTLLRSNFTTRPRIFIHFIQEWTQQSCQWRKA